jgi:protein-disulfide isomerase
MWQEDQAEAIRRGVTSTPTVFVNGRLIMGAIPLDRFKTVVEEELRELVPMANVTEQAQEGRPAH